MDEEVDRGPPAAGGQRRNCRRAGRKPSHDRHSTGNGDARARNETCWLITALDAPPQPNLGDLAATKQEYSSYLANASSEAERALAELPDGGPPVEGGQQVIDDVRAQLEQLREDLNEARTQVEQADPNDPSAVVEAARAAGNMLGAQGNARQVLNQITQNAQLNVAYEQATQCRFE